MATIGYKILTYFFSQQENPLGNQSRLVDQRLSVRRASEIDKALNAPYLSQGDPPPKI